MYDVAIVGIGIVSCLGTGIKKVSNSLKAGKSGIVIDTLRQEMGFRSPLTARIGDFVSPELSRKQKKTLTEFGLWGYSASLEAIETAGWNKEEIQSSMTGLIIGNDSTALSNIESVDIVRNEKRTFSVGGARIFKSLTSTVTMNLNTLLGNRGASWTLSSACSSGGHAIGQASDLIKMGRQERIICGGVQEINWESVCSFDATNAFSTNIDNPEEASRPFDSERDGLVPGGGAAIVALERFDMAKKRGADILGRVISYSFSSDGARLSLPSGDGLERCMGDVLKRGGKEVSDIDYISAHATSTPPGDLAEAGAIYNIFGTDCPWVSSFKSMTGHEMWMSGASQVVYSTIMGMDGFIAKNLNFRKQEKDAPRLKIAMETIDKKPKTVLLNSAGFGGTNSCLILEFEK